MTRRILWLMVLVMFTMTAGVASGAEDDDKTITDPEKAGIEYEIQGEYAGTYEQEGEEKKVGGQVIALGDGKFRLVGFFGGLPGDGWKRGDKTRSAEGELQDGVVKMQDKDTMITIQDGTVTVSEGEHSVELKKVHRKSPTLGAKPPEGAIVLFDGTSADAFDNGKIVMEDLLLADCSSKKEFKDHSLHLEFRTPFKPHARGQARGNSGMYVQSRYEVQILDSFGLEGKNNECGGIYSIAEPAVNMCFPPLAWQTYDYDFTAARYDEDGNKTENARVTIRHNGVVIHDNLELPHGTPGRLPEGPGAAPLYLQGHGNPVVFRNIWVVEK